MEEAHGPSTSDTQVANGALDLGMAKRLLNGAQTRRATCSPIRATTIASK
jgi:hypothetical protein